MTAYLDTSFLIKLYIFEADSHVAARLVQRSKARLVISGLSEVEMAAALHRKSTTIHSGVTRALTELAYGDFRLDVTDSVYDMVSMSDRVMERARILGETYGSTHRVRALDILHVAAALECGASAFATFDAKQAKMAEDAGLKLLS